MTVDGRQAKFIHADLTQPKETKSFVEQGIKHFGRIDILVNNAGIQHINKV